ncbi:MAG: aldo/keto reductase [Betaproteobacteria bacterium]|nr:aldo/keto reductase [Betaproteobacteria bacterium]
MAAAVKSVRLPDGAVVPALGLGTWRLGEGAATHARDVATVRQALDVGYRLIDTAEMYGEGGAEQVVGEAVRAALRAGTVAREALCIVSKVYPHNAGRQGAVQACERSLKRLGLDHIDLYLLHWRGSVPLAQTVEAFEQLKAQGKIARWGVSNFDVADLDELLALPEGAACATNQVYYCLGERGLEFDLLPWQRGHAMPLMAYSPLGIGALAADASLARLAAPLGLSAAQLALAWVLRQPDVIAIPKAARPEHLRDNLAAAGTTLDAATRAALDALFPPPARKQPLAMN